MKPTLRIDSPQIRHMACAIGAAMALMLWPLIARCSEQEPSREEIRYDEPVKLGLVNDEEIRESSGLAASYAFAGCFWTHNDSSDSARLFLLDGDGATKATYSIDSVEPKDWEAMAVVRVDGVTYLVIGDVGDNLERREHLTLTIVKEPDALGQPDGRVLSVHATIEFRFEDGPHDCEAIAIDAAAGQFVMLTKSFNGPSRAYTMPLMLESPNAVQTARLVARPDVPFVTGMDISPDGQRAMIVNYVGAYEFTRRDGESWKDAFNRDPRILPIPYRRQGEAICYALDGRSIVLTSEGRKQPLWFVPTRVND